MTVVSILLRSDLAKVARHIGAVLRALPHFHGTVVLVVRDGRIDHIKTEQVEKLDDLPEPE